MTLKDSCSSSSSSNRNI